MDQLDYWKFAAGLGLFLFAMARLESALKELSGRRFKLLIKKYTTNRFLSVLNGIAATAVLQSSTVVMLIVIAFAGAGILSLSNSLGIILGANLGTTVTGWIVSALGFKFDLQSALLPLIGLGGIGAVVVGRRPILRHLFEFIIALGLLLFGLSLIKDGMGQLAKIFGAGELASAGPIAYFFIGFVLAAIIHSSSVTMTVALSALNANLIGLAPAAYMIIGADLGTTMTAMTATLRGSPVKKRVGLAHFLFNLGTNCMALSIVGPSLGLIQQRWGVDDPLFALVAFHSLFNFAGILVFFPFLGAFERFLNRFFMDSDSKVCRYIHKVTADVPEAALEAIRLELREFAELVIEFNGRIFNIDAEIARSDWRGRHQPGDNYDRIKRIEGELLDYFVKLQKEMLGEAESIDLSRYILALRNGVLSAKAAKDVEHNMVEFDNSVDEFTETLMRSVRQTYAPVVRRVEEARAAKDKSHFTEALLQASAQNDVCYGKVNELIYAARRNSSGNSENSGVMVATFLNVNREIHDAHRLLIDALNSIGTS